MTMKDPCPMCGYTPYGNHHVWYTPAKKVSWIEKLLGYKDSPAKLTIKCIACNYSMDEEK